MKPSIYTRDLLPDAYQIGEHTYGHPNVYDWSQGTTLRIGKYTSIADEVTILLGGNHRMDWATMYPFPALHDEWPEAAEIEGHPWTKGDVVIGNDVWICNGATILSGVTIGDGAVIAARSLVLHDVEPYTIVGGNPAKPIKRRFKKKGIRALQEAKWWDWPEAVIRANVAALCNGDIDEIVRIAQSIEPSGPSA